MMKKWVEKALFLAIPAALALAAGMAAAIATQTDPSTGLARRKGSLGAYVSEPSGIFVTLARSGKDAWGFLEWPGKRFYGFFSGKEEGGELRALLGTPGKSMRLILSGKPLRAGYDLRLEGEGGMAGNFRLSPRPVHHFGMETCAGELDAGMRVVSPLGTLFRRLSAEDGASRPESSWFHIDALTGRPRSLGAIFDADLRRGSAPLEYSRGHWKTFRSDRALAEGPKVWPASFIERQYLLSDLAGVCSVAAQRYVFDGGAHGNTTTMISMIDAGTGGILEGDDIFWDGWKEALAPKIRAEALRLLGSGSAAGGAGARANGGSAGSAAGEVSGGAPRLSLTDFGFFSDEIFPSQNIFLCRTGVGFHYDRYELAAYAAGDFTFVVPWSELSEQLKIAVPRG